MVKFRHCFWRVFWIVLLLFIFVGGFLYLCKIGEEKTGQDTFYHQIVDIMQMILQPRPAVETFWNSCSKLDFYQKWLAPVAEWLQKLFGIL